MWIKSLARYFTVPVSTEENQPSTMVHCCSYRFIVLKFLLKVTCNVERNGPSSVFVVLDWQPGVFHQNLFEQEKQPGHASEAGFPFFFCLWQYSLKWESNYMLTCSPKIQFPPWDRDGEESANCCLMHCVLLSLWSELWPHVGSAWAFRGDAVKG